MNRNHDIVEIHMTEIYKNTHEIKRNYFRNDLSKTGHKDTKTSIRFKIRNTADILYFQNYRSLN